MSTWTLTTYRPVWLPSSWGTRRWSRKIAFISIGSEGAGTGRHFGTPPIDESISDTVAKAGEVHHR